MAWCVSIGVCQCAWSSRIEKIESDYELRTCPTPPRTHTHTVNPPVMESKPTWILCWKLVGPETPMPERYHHDERAVRSECVMWWHSGCC